MRGVVPIFLCLLLAPLSWSAGLPDIIDRVKPAVVGVGTAYPPRQPGVKGETVSYLATGFVVGDGRQVVTNAHAIPPELDTEHNESLVIFAGRGAQAEARIARVVKTDERHDLAVLAFEGARLPAVELGDSVSVREGTEVAITGFPIGMVLGLYPVTHRGIVAAITPIVRPVESARSLDAVQLQRMRNPFDALQLDAIAYPGNSGSPVYETETGKVIGVLNSVFVKESKESALDRPTGISYAIPVAHLHHLLSQSP